MNVRWAVFLPMWTFIAILAFLARLEAQVVPPSGALSGPVYSPEAPAMGGYPPSGMSYPAGPMGPDAGMYGPGGGAAMGPGPVDGGGMMGGPMMGDPAAYGGMGEGGYPCDTCGPGFGNGFCRDIMGLIGPYGDGGCGAPRYFDVSIEAMWLQRDSAGRNINLASEGIAGPVALSTSQLNFEERPSFRFSAWLQFRSRANLEFTYYGQFHHRDSVQVNSPTDNLFSALSEFGTVPPGGFLEEGNAAYNRIEYSSVFDNFEVNYRRHWQGPNTRFQGSWLVGIRYFKLDEDFDYIAVSPFNAGQLRYAVNTNNSLTGIQTGGDLWVCIIPGLRAGVEGKAGVYGNHTQQGTRIDATTLALPYTEDIVDNDVAFVGDAAFYLTYRLSQQFNLKFGYNFLYVDGVSLATENFNPEPPNVFFAGTSRTPQLNDNGSVFYHGASVGVEYNW
jgi:hypothetical protein